MNEIVPGILFLGDYDVANDQEELDRAGILTVVNISNIRLTRQLQDLYETAGIRYYFFPAEDDPQQNIAQFFEPFLAIMKDAPKPVLVHCRAGISRSATLAIFFVMQYYGLPVTEAFLRVRNKRSIIEPNGGFMRQLREWATLPETSLFLTTLRQWADAYKQFAAVKKIEDNVRLSDHKRPLW